MRNKLVDLLTPVGLAIAVLSQIPSVAAKLPGRPQVYLLAGLLLVLLHLVMISRQVDGGGSGGGSLLERVVFAALSPLQTAVAWGGRAVRGSWNRYVGLRRVEQQNQVLEQRLRENQLLLQERSQRALEAERLRDLLEPSNTALRIKQVGPQEFAVDGLSMFKPAR